ncbi:hypothetical protein BC938DRAFT_470493 [Jimgerdemannia flammicorona]|uniref:BHLH domain-containing protein n=1 Tax=Jimgerdemannia flammicorona TaxID=994334 RepID=A0A433R0S1_9FUNG|nr:hypothetical protein BC938DRAFT_470493 [Jimgerdemannia flammicorona]
MSPAIDSTMTFSNTFSKGQHQFTITASHPPTLHNPSVYDFTYYDSSAPSSRASSPRFEDDEEVSDDDELDIKERINSNQPLFLNFTPDLSPQTATKKKPKAKKNTTYKVNGVNILNRNSLDSNVAMERLKRRRENHNYVERRRRDNINHTIFEISEVVPNAFQPGQKPNKGNILRLALEHIKELQSENRSLRQELGVTRDGSSPRTPEPVEKSVSNEDTDKTSPAPAISSVPVIHLEPVDPASPFGIYTRYQKHPNSADTLTPAATLEPHHQFNLSIPALPRSPCSLPSSPRMYPTSAPRTYSVPNSPNGYHSPQQPEQITLRPISLPGVEHLHIGPQQARTSGPMLVKLAFQTGAPTASAFPQPYGVPNGYPQMAPYSASMLHAGDAPSKMMGLEKQNGSACHY